MPWEPPEVKDVRPAQAAGGWSPPEARDWSPPEVATKELPSAADFAPIERAKNAVIAVPQSFALSVGNSISGVARARDTLVEGEGLAMFSPSPNQAKYKSNQRFRAFEAAMLDPSYSQHLIDARTPEETAKIEKLLGPPGKLEGLQFKDEQSRIYANNLGLEQQKRLETDPLYQYGQEYNQAAKTVYPTDPALDQKIESKFARAVGGTLPTVALSLIPGVGPALATTQYATGQSESGAVEAIEAGHPELASEAALLNLFTGAASEYALGATSKLKSILASPRLAVYFKRFAAAYPKTLGVTEAVVREIAQEGLEQGMGNVIAADVVGYDPNRPWSQGVMEAGGMGGAAVVPYALLGSFGRRGRGAAPASQAGGNESSAALDRVNEQLAANPIQPADPGTPAAGGGLPAETRAPAVGQFVFQQGGNKIVIKAPTENIAKEYAFRTSPGAVFVRADLPAATGAKGQKPADTPGEWQRPKPLEPAERHALESRAQAKITSGDQIVRGRLEKKLDQIKSRHQVSRQEARDAKTIGERIRAEMDMVDDENSLRRMAGETELETDRPITEADQEKSRQWFAKRVKEIESKLANGEPIDKQDRQDWRIGGRKSEELPPEPTPPAATGVTVENLSELQAKRDAVEAQRKTEDAKPRKQGLRSAKARDLQKQVEELDAKIAPLKDAEQARIKAEVAAQEAQARLEKERIEKTPLSEEEKTELESLRFSLEYRGNLPAASSARLRELEIREKNAPPAATGATAQKMPWEMTGQEYMRSKRVTFDTVPDQSKFDAGKQVAARKDHEMLVRTAVREGKPVPESVLADYPDLKPAPPAATGAAAQKMPWELTKAEFLKENPLSDSQIADENFFKELIRVGDKQPSGLVTVTWKQMLKAKEKLGVTGGIEKLDNAAGVITTLIPGKQYSVQTRKGFNDLFHRGLLKAALREGKPVPESVLADYPDLKPARPAATGAAQKVAVEPAIGVGKVLEIPASSTKAERKAFENIQRDIALIKDYGPKEMQLESRARRKSIERADISMRRAAEVLGLELPRRSTFYNPESDLANANKLEAELRDLFGKTQPTPAATGAVPVELKPERRGAAWTASTPHSEAEVGGRYELAELAELKPSSHPDFPPEFQNRIRSGAANAEQIAEMKRKLNPSWLADSLTTDIGSPMVDEFNYVLSGNGRTFTLRDLYSEQHQKGEEYRQWIKANAERFGFDPDQVARLKQPVLVRRVHDFGGLSKEQFVDYSNRPNVARMTAAERARADAMAMSRDENKDLLNLFQPDESGDVLSASNRSFLNRFVQVVGGEADLRTADGFNGPVIETRVKNALLATAIGHDNPVLIQQLIEGTEGFKHAVNGVMRSLPNIVRLHGTEYDLKRPLGQALSDLVRVRSQGLKVSEFLDQNTLFSDPGQRTAASDALLILLDAASRKSARAVADLLNSFVNSARQQGGSSDLFGAQVKTAAEILKSLYENDKSRPADQPDLPKGKPPESPPANQKPPPPGAGEKPQDPKIFTDQAANDALNFLKKKAGVPPEPPPEPPPDKESQLKPVRLTSLAPSDSSTGASVNSPADPDSAMAAVQAIVNEEAGDVSVTVNHDATLKHDGQVVEGYVHPVTGQIVLNSAAPTMADPANVRRVVREERAHWLLSFTAEGRQALREFIGRITPADRAELQRQGYRRLPGETATDYEARLTNEYIAKQARENTAWWRKMVERVREWLAKNGLAKLTNEEAARAILRRLNAAQAERQLAHGYLQASNGVLTAPWARVKNILTSLTAHHGTPHQVDKFTTAKIGTGEGSQVYGWGLYFAENEKVAKQYADNLSRGPRVMVGGREVDTVQSNPVSSIAAQIRERRVDNDFQGRHETDVEIVQAIRRVVAARLKEATRPEAIAAYKTQLQAFDNMIAEGIATHWGKQTYTVTLAVEDEDLLDWDKPLSEQSEKVRKLLANDPQIYKAREQWRRGGNRESTAQDIYRAIASGIEFTGSYKDTRQVASEYLAKHGIRGIRYLDQGSRVPSQGWVAKHPQGGELVYNFKKDAEAYIAKNPEYRLIAPKQTYNYVIFDENDIIITHENGQPVSAGQLMPQFSLAPVTPVSPPTQTQIAVIEQQAGNVNETPPAPTLTTAPELRSKLRDMVGSVSGVIHYYGGQALLRAMRGIDLKASYQAAAVKGQTDALLNELFSSAYNAASGFKLPQWMKVGAWANRTRAFTKRLLHVAARLNATGRNPDGTFRFDDFKVRSGMMTIRAFKDGQHAIGDTFLHIDPNTEITEQFEIGPFVTTPDGRAGHQIFRSMEANTQAELYRTMSESFPELMWLLDMFIDPALASVRKTINGIEIPVFNRFAQAAMMAEADPNFTPLTGYTPDVLVSRSLLGAIRGALSFSQGTRSPGRKYKFGTSRESGHVRDLLTGFNVRTFQMLQEKARREWRNAVLKAAKPIPKGVVPAGWVKLETGMEELWQAAKRLRNWQSPVRYQSASEKLEQMTLDQLRASLDYNENLVWKNDEWMIEYTPFKETQARLADDGSQEYKHFFSEIFALRGKQLMLPQPLIEALLKKYVAVKQHGALYRLAAWGVRNSTQLFLVMPKTYVANVLTNDLFALEAGTRYALRGLMSANANDLRFARNLFTGTFTNRFAAFRQGTGFFAGSDYMTAIRETLPDQIFADSTSLAEVKVRWGNSALDYLRQGEIGGAALQLIGYGSIDVRAKQRMAFAFLKAAAVNNAKRAGLTGNALKAAVDRYLANPPMNDRIQAVEIANFELLNYADSPQVLNDMAQNDFSRLVLPFPRFGYHYVTKQLKRLSAAKVLIGKVPKGQRANAFADLVTVGLYGAGGGGILALALASVLGGDDDDDARQRIGTSTVPVVNADGSVTMRPIDREFVTANRINISAWARASGIESDRADDFWLRVRNYPVVAAAGVTALAYHDAKKYGAATGARQFASGAADLASDFFSVGAAVKVPFKVLAEWQSMGKPMAAQSLVDPFATGVPLSFYITEQLTDSFIPGSRQADELIAWINPTRPRRTASKLLNYSPGVVESLESSHLTGLITTLARGGESGLPPAGKIDRRTATVPQPSVISAEERWSSLGGFNIKAIPRQEYQRAIQPNK